MTSSCCYTSTAESVSAPTLVPDPPKLTYKIVIVGDSNVGKTTLVHRLVHGTLSNLGPTNGAAYNDYYIDVEEKRIHCQLWDTAGQERFQSLVPMYIRDTDLCLIALSLAESEETNAASLQRWRARLEESSENALVILVGTKSDLSDARIPNLEYITTSATTDYGIEELRTAIIKSIASLLQPIHT